MAGRGPGRPESSDRRTTTGNAESPKTGRMRRKPYTQGELEGMRQAKIELERAIESMAGNGLSPQEITLLTGIKPERLYRKYHQHFYGGGSEAERGCGHGSFAGDRGPGQRLASCGCRDDQVLAGAAGWSAMGATEEGAG